MKETQFIIYDFTYDDICEIYVSYQIYIKTTFTNWTRFSCIFNAAIFRTTFNKETIKLFNLIDWDKLPNIFLPFDEMVIRKKFKYRHDILFVKNIYLFCILESLQRYHVLLFFF